MSFNRRAITYLFQMPGVGMTEGIDFFVKPGNNNITIRPADIIEDMPAIKPSETLLEARMKTKRLYKRFCRLSPFLLRIYEMNHKIEPEIANRNFANKIKFLQNIKDKTLIDKYVSQLYVVLYEATYVHGENYHFANLCVGYHYRDESSGENIYQQKKQTKSKFLGNFYKIDRPLY